MQTQFGLGTKLKKVPKYTMKQNLIDLRSEIALNKTSYLLMAPFMILFIMFTVVPVISAIGLSLTYYNIIQPPHFIGWSNFKQLFLNDDVFLISLENTFLFAIITGPISYLACLLIAWFVNDLKPKVRAFVTLLFYAPSLAGAGVFVIWRNMIFSGDAYGVLNGWLMQNGFVVSPILWLTDTKYTKMVVIVVSVWLSLGTSFLSFIAGLQGIDRSLYEAGVIDGISNRWQEFYFITIPSMKPQLMFGAVMQISATFGIGDIVSQLLGFPSPLYSAHTIVLHMLDYGSTRYEMGYASSIAVVLFTITIVVNEVIKRLIKLDD